MASHPNRPEIEARLRAGEFESFNQLAREFGVSVSTISRYATSLGVDALERSKTKKATEVRVAYDHERRLALIDQALEKGQRQLDALPDNDTAAYQRLSVGIGTYIDKRRQEEGKASQTLDVNHAGHLTHGHISLEGFSPDELRQLRELARRRQEVQA